MIYLLDPLLLAFTVFMQKIMVVVGAEEPVRV